MWGGAGEVLGARSTGADASVSPHYDKPSVATLGLDSFFIKRRYISPLSYFDSIAVTLLSFMTVVYCGCSYCTGLCSV